MGNPDLLAFLSLFHLSVFHKGSLPQIFLFQLGDIGDKQEIHDRAESQGKERKKPELRKSFVRHGEKT